MNPVLRIVRRNILLPRAIAPGAVLLLLVAACATTPKAPKAGSGGVNSGPAEHHLDGAVVRTQKDPLTDLSVYTPQELFHLAGDLDRQKQRPRAILVYQRLIEEFPDSTLFDPASFNLGLLFEAEKQYENAANAYFGITSKDEPTTEGRRRTWMDAHYRLAVNFGKLGYWWKSVAVFDAILDLPWLDNDDRLEALTGRGIAIQETGELDAAEVALSAVLIFYRRAQRSGRIADRSLVAEAAFRLGEISRQRYLGVQLQFPVKLLTERLTVKCEHLISAQHRYIRAIRNGDTHTVAAAGFRIGALYEDLYDKIVGLQTPEELDVEQADVYQEEVRNKVNVLVKKALKIYEQALMIGHSTGGDNVWVKQLQASIERLKQIYLETSASAARTKSIEIAAQH